MPNRYYRITPTPLLSSSRGKIRSLAYLAWQWSSGTISVVLLVLVTLVSCAPVFTPTTLQDFKESRETSSTTAVERPRLALSPHSDGLGWTVRVTQTIEEKNRIRREEVWGGYTYERRLNLVTMVGGGLLCAPNLLLNTLFSMGTPNQPGWSSPWQYCLAAAGYDVPGRADTRTRIADDLDPQVQTVTRIIVDGDLRLTFAADGRDRIGIAVPVSKDSQGTHIRLRWLAMALREQGVNPADVPDGTVEISYSPTVGNPGPTTQLPIDGHVLTAMLQHDLAVLPQDRWPKQPRLRLAVNNDWGHEQSQLIVNRLIGRMKERGLPLVLRNERYRKLVPVQVRQLAPFFNDERQPSAGMGTGANLLVSIDIASASDQGLLLTTTLVSVETAQVLAQFVLECPINAVAPTAETLAAVVTVLVLPHGPTLTRGWFVTP